MDDLQRRISALARSGGGPALSTPEPVAPLPGLSFAELMAATLPERIRLFPFMPEGSLVMLHAPRGVGKTWFQIGLANALVTGQSFLGWPVGKAVGVLMIDGEMDLPELRDRIKALVRDTPQAPFITVSHQIVSEHEQKDMDFAQPYWQDRLKATVLAHPEIRVVIFDNLTHLWPNTPENKRDDWARDVQPFLMWLRRKGISVILVHHSNKNGGQRGSSAHEDMMTAVIRLDPIEGTDLTDGAHFKLRFTKSRSAFGDAIKPLDVTLGTDPEGRLVWDARPLEESNADRLLALVRSSEDGLRIADAAEELGLSNAMIHKLKTQLTKEGRLLPGPHLRAA
jgi:putative DNA primase/helicase